MAIVLPGQVKGNSSIMDLLSQVLASYAGKGLPAKRVQDFAGTLSPDMSRSQVISEAIKAGIDPGQSAYLGAMHTPQAAPSKRWIHNPKENVKMQVDPSQLENYLSQGWKAGQPYGEAGAKPKKIKRTYYNEKGKTKTIQVPEAEVAIRDTQMEKKGFYTAERRDVIKEEKKQQKELVSIENKIQRNAGNQDSTAPLVDYFNQNSNKSYVYVWGEGKWFGGKWKKVKIPGNIPAKDVSSLATSAGVSIEEALQILNTKMGQRPSK